MKKLFLTGVAALLLATGMAHVATAQSASLTERQKAEVYRMSLEACVRRGIKDGTPTTPFTIEETWEYCRCGAETIADLVTIEEYNLGILPEKSPESAKNAKESLLDKVACIAVEKCKKHLNLRDPSQYQFERCWKG